MPDQFEIKILDEAIRKGDAARQLLDNPAFIAVIDERSHYHLTALVEAKPKDKEAIEYHHLMHSAIREIYAEISEQINTATQASLRLEQMRLNNEMDDYD